MIAPQSLNFPVRSRPHLLYISLAFSFILLDLSFLCTPKALVFHTAALRVVYSSAMSSISEGMMIRREEAAGVSKLRESYFPSNTTNSYGMVLDDACLVRQVATRWVKAWYQCQSDFPSAFAISEQLPRSTKRLDLAHSCTTTVVLYGVPTTADCTLYYYSILLNYCTVVLCCSCIL